MSARANSVSAYRETSVRTASGGKIIVMLYDEAIRQLDSAIDGLDSGSRQFDRISNSILKAQDIITELMVSLDFERGGDIAPKLFSLYQYFNDQLMQGNISKDPEPVRSVRSLMDELRGAWAQIAGTTQVQGRVAGVNIAG
jgi:flagellar protein FliS